MQIFKLGRNYQAVCETQSTRNGFRHVATLLHNGHEVGSVKETYLNRTWESYEYETVLRKLVSTYFGDKDKKTLPRSITKFIK